MKHVTEILMPEPEENSCNIPTGIGGPSSGGNLARRRYQRGALRLEGKKWILRWREDSVGDGGNVRRPERRAQVGTIIDYPTKRLARRAADRIIEPLNAPEYRPGRVATVTEFAEIYKRDGLTGHKPTARKASRHHLENYIVPVLGETRLDEISGSIVQRVVNAGIANKLSRKTILNVLGTLRAMLKRARRWNYQVTTFAYGDITLPPEEIHDRVRSYTTDESLLLIENAPSLKWKTCFATMGYLGLRCGEALGIAWDHVDLDAHVLTVRQAVVEGEIQTVKSKNSRRDLHIPEYLIALLREYRIPMQRMTDEERERLSLYLRDNDLQDWMIWRLMEEGFLRISEVLALRAGDILPDGRIVCHRKKGSATNVLPIRDSELWSAICVLLRIRPNKSDVLFNRPRRTFDWRLKQAGEKCGVPVEKCHAHVAKHNACQQALEETGHSVLAVKQLAGHQSVSSTLAYVEMTTADALKLREGQTQ